MRKVALAKVNLVNSTREAFEDGRRLVAPLMGYPGVGLTRTTTKVALQNCEAHYNSIKALVDRFQPDAVFPLMQLTVEANALGIETVFPVHDVPQLKEGTFNIEEIEEQIAEVSVV